MKAHSVFAEHNGASLPPTCRCVIVYEDFVSGLSATRFANMLAEALGEACDCSSLWRSELLEFSEIALGAARDAAASDFVIIALRADRPLSRELKGWVESWLTQRLKASFSLIVLFDSPRSTSHAA